MQKNGFFWPLVGEGASETTRTSFREKLRSGEMDDKIISIEISDSPSPSTIEIPGMPGAQVGMMNISEMFGKAFGQSTKTLDVKVSESYDILLTEESDKLIDDDQIIQEAIFSVENNGIVFLDEIDKICGRSSQNSTGDVSREGVQRDLLPLIEGTTVGTKYGPVKSDHILFIASGAFHVSSPSDLLPELQGRLPIRVGLNALTKDDFKAILVEPKASLIKQYIALMGTEDVTLTFTDAAIDTIAEIAVQVNSSVENIGARRLMTVLEKVLDIISFEASDQGGQTINIDEDYVRENIGELANNTDLSKYIL